MTSTIISTSDLQSNLDNPSFILLDCRTDLKDPAWGYLDFKKRHIRGSHYIDLNTELSSPISPTSGRHPLPDPQRFIETVAKYGIEPNKQVVAVDTAFGTFAARIWWLLRALGHRSVAVLDGGFNKWLNEQREVVDTIPITYTTDYRYSPAFTSKPFVTTEEMEKIFLDPEVVLFDARAPERFRGEVEPIDTVAGHIPGAVNRWTSDNLNPDGSLKSPETLNLELRGLLKGRKNNRVISYCGSGVTSCHNVLALEVAGVGEATLYPGSWSEWIRNPQHPIEKNLPS